MFDKEKFKLYLERLKNAEITHSVSFFTFAKIFKDQPISTYFYLAKTQFTSSFVLFSHLLSKM